MDPQLKRLKGRVPAWWADAKLGIFVHWVPASVPGFAPTDREIGSLLASDEPDPLSTIPYSEWYENSLRFLDSPVARHHRATYGDRPYAKFVDDFVAGLSTWDPEDWARRFAATGARYVVLVTKHHDGWCLWPSQVPNPHRPGWFSERDLVGELADAVRAVGMRFGVYYSGGYDWTFDQTPIGSVGSGLAAIPGGDYPAYADAQVRELIERYRPSVLWNDIAWPAGKAATEALQRHYLDVVPDGVVNDRWMPTTGVVRAAGSPRLRRLVDAGARRSARKSGGLVPPPPPFFQHRTPEFTSFDEVQRTPWESVRGMDGGFGFNRTSNEADHLSRPDLLRSIADIAATGGNLLLNVGPRGEDATIPDSQLRRLDWLAEWAPVLRAALQGSRPWVTPRARTPEGVEVRFTAAGDQVRALCWAADPHRAFPTSITLPFRSTVRTTARSIDGADLEVEAVAAGLLVRLPPDPDADVFALSFEHVTAR
ncbi:alpha-L-fucosidase [soil metagenome]